MPSGLGIVHQLFCCKRCPQKPIGLEYGLPTARSFSKTNHSIAPDANGLGIAYKLCALSIDPYGRVV